ncbi:lysophospholipid acyltransferase family protein [Pelagibacterium montanilacus]|uniref:lysophospholipid acyltransferase family protein n=1 Tax=Pelagibacterium montanilacus TaxID=2185280 RepID=UPI000F8F24E6|nr:lysophospholipid acyltransferase family protein [Pelagibacterium montanilacus]
MIGRLVFIGLVIVPFTLLGLVPQMVLVAAKSRRRRVLPRLFFRLLAIALGLKVSLCGQPPAEGGTLYLANHISWLDIIAIGAHLPVSFVAKSEVGRAPLVGFFAGLGSTLYIERAKRTDTGRAARDIGARIADGDQVLLFAEGTSDAGTHVLPFRSALVGAATGWKGAAGQCEASIQPVTIAYRSVWGLPISRAERMRVAWIGAMGVGESLVSNLRAGPREVAIGLGAPFPACVDRKALARRAEGDVRAMLVALNRDTRMGTDPLPSGGAWV